MSVRASSELWPQGNNKQLLHSMFRYFEEVMKEHGTRLPENQLSKLYKVKEEIRGLLKCINDEKDYRKPELNFTLPGIYKFYNSNCIKDTKEPSPAPTLPTPQNPHYLVFLPKTRDDAPCLKPKYAYDPSQKQCIAIMDCAMKRYLSVYNDGTSELKKCCITCNQIFTSIPIDQSCSVYLKTSGGLYLGSDEYGFLFLGNVTKHHQIWTIETEQSAYRFKNHYGLYLCANENSKVFADSATKTESVRFEVHPIDHKMNDENCNMNSTTATPQTHRLVVTNNHTNDALINELKRKLIITNKKKQLDQLGKKPALPPRYPTHIVIKKIRSKYSRPLPALPHKSPQ
eukprot:71304_1